MATTLTTGSASVDKSTVLVSDEGAIRILTLNRPEKRNAADLDLQQRLVAALREAEAAPELRAIVLTGAGQAFSAGGDRDMLQRHVTGSAAPHEAAAAARVHVDTIEVLMRIPVPTIAAVNGFAVGYAAGVVALCDMVVMAEDAFLSDPHVQFGIGATSGTQFMWPRLASIAFAKEALMSGRKVYADEAARVGLANRVGPPGGALAPAMELARTFAALPPKGVAATKRAFNAPLIAEMGRLLAAG